MSGLDRESRERLLAEARQLAQDAPPAVLKQAAAALAILRQQGPDALAAALRPDVEYRSGAYAQAWKDFRRRIGSRVTRLLGDDPAAAAYLLGWLKRLGSIQQQETAVGRRMR